MISMEIWRDVPVQGASLAPSDSVPEPPEEKEKQMEAQDCFIFRSNKGNVS